MKYPILMSADEVLKILSDNAVVSGTISVLLMLFGAVYGTAAVTRAGMVLLILLIIIDWVTGFNAAKKDQIDTSSYGIEGLYRTMVLLLIPAVAHYLDVFFYTHGVLSYFMIAALARHLLKSAIANTHRVGWTQWIPTEALGYLVKWVADEIAHKDSRALERYNQIHREGDD